MPYALTIYVAAALAEIAGCLVVWAVLRHQAHVLWLLPGGAALFAFAWLLTLSPAGFAGRAFAAYGGVYIASSVAWGWFIEGQRPDRWDISGGVLAVVAGMVILFGPRG